MAILDDLCNRLSKDPPMLPSWIFVPATSTPPILDAIHYWMATAKTIKTEIALQLHKIPDPHASISETTGAPGPMFPDPGNMTGFSQGMLREVYATTLDGMTSQQLFQTGLLPAYLASSEIRQYFERNKSHIVDVMVERMKAVVPSSDTDVEVRWHMMTKTVPIPKELEARHTALKQLSDAVRKNGDIPKALITKVFLSG